MTALKITTAGIIEICLGLLMNKCNKTLILLIAAIAIGCFFFEREEVTISDLEWSCEVLECGLSFIVTNRSESR